MPLLNAWCMQNKFVSPQWPIAHNDAQIRITRRIRNRIRKQKVYETEAQRGLIDDTYNLEDENLALLSL
jgi:hypothetical protein